MLILIKDSAYRYKRLPIPSKTGFGAPDVDVSLEAVADDVAAELVAVAESLDASVHLVGVFEFADERALVDVPELDAAVETATEQQFAREELCQLRDGSRVSGVHCGDEHGQTGRGREVLNVVGVGVHRPPVQKGQVLNARQEHLVLMLMQQLHLL